MATADVTVKLDYHHGCSGKARFDCTVFDGDRQREFSFDAVNVLLITGSDSDILQALSGKDSVADGILAAADGYSVIRDIPESEDDISAREEQRYQEAWTEYGADDFIRTVTARFSLRGEEADLLYYADHETLLNWCESLNPCGDFHDGGEPVVRRSVERMQRKHVDEMLPALLKDERERMRCYHEVVRGGADLLRRQSPRAAAHVAQCAEVVAERYPDLTSSQP